MKERLVAGIRLERLDEVCGVTVRVEGACPLGPPGDLHQPSGCWAPHVEAQDAHAPATARLDQPDRIVSRQGELAPAPVRPREELVRQGRAVDDHSYSWNIGRIFFGAWRRISATAVA